MPGKNFDRRDFLKSTAIGTLFVGSTTQIGTASEKNSNEIVGENQLIARWPLAGNFNDTVGDNNGSADIGDPKTGVFNGRDAVAFDGSSGLRVSRGGNEELSRAGRNDGPTTYTMWVYFDEEVPGADTNHSLWLNDTGYQIRAHPIDATSGVQIRFRVSHAGGSNTYNMPDDADTIVPINQWHHIAVVAEAENEVKIYINGQERFHDDSMDGYNEFDTDFWTDKTIGARYGWNPERWGDFMQGKMSDLRIYNTRLSSEEVYAIYDGMGPDVPDDSLEEAREEKRTLADRIKTISISEIDEQSAVEALFDEYETLLQADEVDTEQAQEAVDRLIMAEDVINRALEVTGRADSRDEGHADYNMAAQVYASLFQGIVEWKFAAIEIKNTLSNLTGYEEIISAALDYLTDALEDHIVEQTVGFMQGQTDRIDEETVNLAEKAVETYELAEDVSAGDIRSIVEEFIDPLAKQFGDMGQRNVEEDGSSQVLADGAPGYREQVEMTIENTSPEVWEDETTYQETIAGAEVLQSDAIGDIEDQAQHLENSIEQEHDDLLDLIETVLNLKRAGPRDLISILRELAQFIWDRLPIVRSGFNTGQGIVLAESVVDEAYEGVEGIVGREDV